MYTSAAARNAYYGIDETNNIEDFTDDFDAYLGTLSGTVTLADRSLVRITRLRLIGACREYPFWDLSYCFGQLADGTNVRVDLGAHRFGRFTFKGELVALCKAAGRYGKDLGIFTAISTL